MVITNQREIQMINLASFPTETSSLDKILDNYDKKTIFYLAPEELELLNKKSRGRIIDSKAEAFSLGISILEAALLENSEDLYELRPTRSLNEAVVMERLQRVRQKYPVLESYLSLMLKLRPEDRLSGG